MTPGKTIALTRLTFVSKVMSLLFNMLSSLVITFLLRSKHLLISCLQSPSAMILEPQEIKSVTVSIVSPSICHEVMGPDVMILTFEWWVLSQLFHSSFTFIKRFFSSTPLSAIRVVSSAYLRLLIFLPAILIPISLVAQMVKCLPKTSLMAQTVKHLSTMWETWVRSLGWEDSLEKEMSTHSNTLALKIPWMEELGAGYYPWDHKE